MIKNSFKQTGSVHVIIAAFLVVAIIGAVGLIAWKNFLAPNNSHPIVKVAEQESAKESTKTDSVDTTIHDVSITLESVVDVDKMPNYTPASFKIFMKSLLKDNEPVESRIDGCMAIATYQVTKISQVNIQGSMVPTDINKRYNCAGGAPIVWVLTPSGSWDDESLNGPSCVSKNGGLVYEEFAAICYSDTDRLGKNNPNGSITSIAN